ncbi:pleckstrin homology domain-containing family J member 1, partial [Athene cunicularia]
TLSLRGDTCADSPRRGLPQELEPSLGVAEVLLATSRACQRCDAVGSAQKPLKKLQSAFVTLWLQLSRGQPSRVSAEGALPEPVGCHKLLEEQKSELDQSFPRGLVESVLWKGLPSTPRPVPAGSALPPASTLFFFAVLKKRLVKLVVNFLFYFRTDEAEPIGALLLEHCRITKEEENVFSISFIEEPERKYCFECDSEEQCQEWIEALKRASYEFMRRSLIFYRNEIQKMTGKDPLEQYGISEEARFQLGTRKQ